MCQQVVIEGITGQEEGKIIVDEFTLSESCSPRPSRKTPTIDK